MNISISKAQITSLIEDAKREVVTQLLTESSSIRLLTQTQTAAMLDVTTATLSTLDLKPIILAPTKTVRYSLQDIQQYIKNNYFYNISNFIYNSLCRDNFCISYYYKRSYVYKQLNHMR